MLWYSEAIFFTPFSYFNASLFQIIPFLITLPLQIIPFRSVYFPNKLEILFKIIDFYYKEDILGESGFQWGEESEF